MLKAGQHQLWKKKAIGIFNNKHLCTCIKFFYRIVQAFDNIVESLIEFENFTNLSINSDDVLLRGERVIISLYIDYTKYVL